MTTARKINLEGLTGLIKELTGKPNPEGINLQPVLEAFNEMLPLMQKLEEGKLGEEELAKVGSQLRNCHEGLVDVFESFCKARGYNKEQLENYYNDPRNFSQKQWEEIQSARRIVEEKALNNSYS